MVVKGLGMTLGPKALQGSVLLQPIFLKNLNSIIQPDTAYVVALLPFTYKAISAYTPSAKRDF